MSWGGHSIEIVENGTMRKSYGALAFFSLLYFLIIYFFEFYVFYYFLCGDPKMGYNSCHLFTMLTEQRVCVVSVVKINKIGLPKLVFSKFG